MATRIRYRVTHETRYSYTSTVTSSRQLVHLQPRVTPWQEVHRHRIAVTPDPRALELYRSQAQADASGTGQGR